ASAVEGIPMDTDAPYISSGTWSLLGIKLPSPLTDDASRAANWSNEGGVGYIRYQKNIMGMWLVNRLRDELCPDESFDRIVAAAEESGFDETVDANGEIFLAPERMKDAFDASLRVPAQSAGDYFRCAYRSLALCYAQALEELEQNTGRRFDRIYIVGGGAKNRFLNELTRTFSGRQVEALPIEATALGNLSLQYKSNTEESAC
ncbi:MAG: rhamnulokinase, partial [Oscillospiraceae bacterium]|nr:rhamnulokinase [Oscillospiraceae bacterium]